MLGPQLIMVNSDVVVLARHEDRTESDDCMNKITKHEGPGNL